MCARESVHELPYIQVRHQAHISELRPSVSMQSCSLCTANGRAQVRVGRRVVKGDASRNRVCNCPTAHQSIKRSCAAKRACFARCDVCDCAFRILHPRHPCNRAFALNLKFYRGCYFRDGRSINYGGKVFQAKYFRKLRSKKLFKFRCIKFEQVMG